MWIIFSVLSPEPEDFEEEEVENFLIGVKFLEGRGLQEGLGKLTLTAFFLWSTWKPPGYMLRVFAFWGTLGISDGDFASKKING